MRYWPEKLHDTLAVEQKFRVTFSSKMPFAEYEFRKFKLENVSPFDCFVLSLCTNISSCQRQRVNRA